MKNSQHTHENLKPENRKIEVLKNCIIEETSIENQKIDK